VSWIGKYQTGVLWFTVDSLTDAVSDWLNVNPVCTIVTSFFLVAACAYRRSFCVFLVWVHIGATWRIRMSRPCTGAIHSYVKFFDHLFICLISSRMMRQGSRAWRRSTWLSWVAVVRRVLRPLWRQPPIKSTTTCSATVPPSTHNSSTKKSPENCPSTRTTNWRHTTNIQILWLL